MYWIRSGDRLTAVHDEQKGDEEEVWIMINRTKKRLRGGEEGVGGWKRGTFWKQLVNL
jgi:hypothetical protein